MGRYACVTYGWTVQTDAIPSAAASVPSSRGMESLLGGLLLTLCLAAWLLGGGSGWSGDRALAIPAVLLMNLAWLARWPGKPSPSRWLLLGVPAIVVVLPLLQLIPLPSALWPMLPGRAPIAAALAEAGVAPAYPAWSIEPARTEAALWGLCVPMAVYGSMLMLSTVWQRRIVLLAIAVGVLNVLLSLAQIQGSGDESLYLGWNHNASGAVGLFANRNHLADFLVALIPMAVAVWLGDDAVSPGRPRWSVGRVTLGLATVFLAVGVTGTQSRTGFALLMAIVVACGLWAWHRKRTTGGASQRWMQGAFVLTVLLVLQYTLYGLLMRLSEDPLDDLRWFFAKNALQVASLTHGVGWGIGSFPHAYDLIGDASADLAVYVNHVHNDYLELWLEGGVAAALLTAVAVLGVVVRWVGVLRGRAPGGSANAAWATGAGLGLLAILLHSIVDYPLRTTAIDTYAAVLLALLVAPSPAASERVAASRTPVVGLSEAANDAALSGQDSAVAQVIAPSWSPVASRKNLDET